MFLACADWEAAIEEERDACQSVRSSPDASQHDKQCKRKRKVSIKRALFEDCHSSCSQRQDSSTNSDQEFMDTDSIVKKVLGPNNTERIVQMRRHHCRSKKHRTHKKKVLMNTQSSRTSGSDKGQSAEKSKSISSLRSVVSITPINIPEMIEMLSDQQMNSNSSKNCLSPLVAAGSPV